MTILRCTFTPASEVTEKGRHRVDRKLTSKASTEGLAWTVAVTEEGRAEVRGSCAVILEVPATEQPLRELHRMLTPLRRGDHEEVRLVTDLVVREVSHTGGKTKRFRPLFPALTVRLRWLKTATVARGGLPAAVMALASAPTAKATLRARRQWVSDQEWRERQRDRHWVTDTLRESNEALRALGTQPTTVDDDGADSITRGSGECASASA